MEELIINFSKNIVSNNIILSYIFFFVSQSLQILFPPYPGDMVLILEGYLSEIANLNIIIVMINAILATSLSSIVLYNIGESKEERILEFKVIKILFETKSVDKLRMLFERFGPIVIVISKFIPGIFSITVLSAGIFKVKRNLAYASILIVTSLHHILLIILGKVLGENWTLIFYKIQIYNRYIFISLIVAVVIYASMHYIKIKLLK